MSGRKKFMDDDENHLPSGMKRIGYDSRTQRYMFREGNNIWLGEPGSFYGGTMRYSGRAQDAVEDEEEDEEYLEDDTADPVPTYSEKELPKEPSSPRLHAGVDWGVPVHHLSETNAKPPDSAGPSTALKRRATRFKDVAASTVVAKGVVRRLTANRKLNRRAQQNSDATREIEHSEAGDEVDKTGGAS